MNLAHDETWGLSMVKGLFVAVATYGGITQEAALAWAAAIASFTAVIWPHLLKAYRDARAEKLKADTAEFEAIGTELEEAKALEEGLRAAVTENANLIGQSQAMLKAVAEDLGRIRDELSEARQVLANAEPSPQKEQANKAMDLLERRIQALEARATEPKAENAKEAT